MYKHFKNKHSTHQTSLLCWLYLHAIQVEGRFNDISTVEYKDMFICMVSLEMLHAVYYQSMSTDIMGWTLL